MKAVSLHTLLFMFALAVLVTSCKPRQYQTTEITVSAAASLKEAFEQIAKDFESEHPGVKVVLNFAGSQSLRMQIEQGAQVDVFASANHAHLAALVQSGHVISEHHFAENALVIVTPADEERLQQFEDLANVERLVLGGPEVPVGRYSDQVIAKAAQTLGKEFSDKVSANIASRENNVRLALAKVVLGEADAALVYRTDANSAGDQVRVVEIPQEFNELAGYYIGATAAAPAGESGEKFIEYVSSENGVFILSQHGFQPSRSFKQTSGVR